MKKSILLSACLIVIVTIFTKCKKDSVAAPSANFSYTGGVGATAPASIQFTNLSANASTYSWNFGDGGTSTEQNPSHIFRSAGLFTVTLTASNGSSSNTSNETIIVSSPTSVAITQANINSLSTEPITNVNAVFLLGSGNNILWYTSDFVLTTKYPSQWQFTSSYSMTNLSTDYLFIVEQDNGTGVNPTLLGFVGFQPNIYTTNAYPDSVAIPAIETGSAMTLYLKWQ